MYFFNSVFVALPLLVLLFRPKMSLLDSCSRITSVLCNVGRPHASDYSLIFLYDAKTSERFGFINLFKQFLSYKSTGSSTLSLLASSSHDKTTTQILPLFLRYCMLELYATMLKAHVCMLLFWLGKVFKGSRGLWSVYIVNVALRR